MYCNGTAIFHLAYAAETVIWTSSVDNLGEQLQEDIAADG